MANTRMDEAVDVLLNSGNVDELHKKVLFDYCDDKVSREYMTHVLGTGKCPCDCYEDFEYEDESRPECSHCNRPAA